MNLSHSSSRSWQPACSLSALHARAEMLRTVREFFHARDVIEVQTACIGSNTVTDAAGRAVLRAVSPGRITVRVAAGARASRAIEIEVPRRGVVRQRLVPFPRPLGPENCQRSTCPHRQARRSLRWRKAVQM